MAKIRPRRFLAPADPEAPRTWSTLEEANQIATAREADPEVKSLRQKLAKEDGDRKRAAAEKAEKAEHKKAS